MLFEKNETMKLLGHQYLSVVLDNEELKRQYFETFDAIREENLLLDRGHCLQFVMLGIIWGKRMERAKHKDKED